LSYNPKNTHLPCPKCGSSDGYSIDDQGWGHCFACNYNRKVTDTTNAEDVFDKEDSINTTPITPVTTVFRGFRGISKDTIQKFGVDVPGNPKASYEARYPLYQDKIHVANKIRYPKSDGKKPFSVEGSLKDADMFGMHLFPAGSAKAITVTEGQDDCMAAFEMLGSKYPCVSIHSATEAEKQARKHYEYLNSFDSICLCFDNDEPGQIASKKFASMFSIGKVKLFPHKDGLKDANDWLNANKAQNFSNSWWKSQPYKPDGLKMGTELLEDIINSPNHFTVQYPWPALNLKTYGMRLSEAVIVTADTGVGKTSFLKEIEYKLLTDEELKQRGYGVGFLHFEEPIRDTGLGLLSIHNSKPYHLPDCERTTEELTKAYDEVLNNDRVVIYDHFGSNSVDVVLDRVRHMAALNCKYIVLDHLSIIVSDQSGDERKQLDEISTKLKTLCMELNIALLAVVHTNRQGQIRGTAGIEQLANIVLKLERDKESKDEWRRNVTKITVVKNRFCGRTGPGVYLFYNPETNRLSELEPDEVLQYEEGSSVEQW